LGFDGSWWRYTSYYFIGMYFNIILPTSVGGDVVRVWYLDSRSGRRWNAFLSVLLDRLIGLSALLALACLAVIVSPIALPEWLTASVWCTAAAGVFGLLTLQVLTRWTGRFAWVRRLVEGTRLFSGYPLLLCGTAGLSVLVQVLNIVLVWLVGLAIDAPV